MRFSLVSLLACVFVAATSALACAAPPTSLDVTADHVDFFFNRFIVSADGNVRVRLSDGTVLRGQTFSMDLKLNRYLVAGDVRLDGPTAHETGAAFAGYPDLDRSYFLPVAGTPERWTFYGLDWTDKHAGRQQPGDAFYFPDLSGERAYIIARGARIVPRTNVLFDTARIYTAGAYLPTPRYVVTFSSNSHFYENAFQGARFDVGLPVNGSAHSLTALHLRNAPFTGTYLSVDQHFVWDRDWIAAAIDPLTQVARQFNVIGFKHFSPRLEGRLFLQESAESYGIVNRPLNAAAFGELQLNAALKHSSLSYTQDDYWQYLLGIPRVANDAVLSFSPVYDPRWREHPATAQLVWTGFQHDLTKDGNIKFRLRSGIGSAHDIYGYGGYPNLQPGPPDSFYHFVGGTFYTPGIRVGNLFSVSAQYDRQRTWYNVPHNVELIDARASVAKQVDKLHLNTFVAYEVRQTSDYWGSQQLAAYPALADPTCVPPPYSFGCYTGLSAFRGLATSRSVTGATVWTPTQYFTLNLRLARFYDTPAPVPGLYGQPPWQFTGDLRMRLSKQITVDLARSYYFNFANQRWSPQLGFQFSP
jgi:hypothetical protein